MLKYHSSRYTRPDLEPADFPVTDPGEQRHQTNGFSAKKKICTLDFVARALLRVELDIDENERRGINDRLSIPTTKSWM